MDSYNILGTLNYFEKDYDIIKSIIESNDKIKCIGTHRELKFLVKYIPLDKIILFDDENYKNIKLNENFIIFTKSAILDITSLLENPIIFSDATDLIDSEEFYKEKLYETQKKLVEYQEDVDKIILKDINDKIKENIIGY